MRAPLLIIGSGSLLAAAWLYWSRGGAVSATVSDAIETAAELIGVSMFTAEKVPVKYRAIIASSEVQYGLPRDLLARLLYQESHYREDIITGRKTSSVGALGIAQFMPATAREFGIDPLNPAQAIPAAAKYLAQLYKRFGTWPQAVASYNWGQGNVSRKGLAKAPLETRNYIAAILGELGLS